MKVARSTAKGTKVKQAQWCFWREACSMTVVREDKGHLNQQAQRCTGMPAR